MKALKDLFTAVKGLAQKEEALKRAMSIDSPLGQAMAEAGKFLYRHKSFEYSGPVSGFTSGSVIKLVDAKIDLDDAVRLVLDNGKEIKGEMDIYLLVDKSQASEQVTKKEVPL